MFIGKKGTGKTTFINSLVNIILDVKFDDDYRYQLIYEEKNQNKQTESQTKEISIYYIRNKKNQKKYFK